MLKKLKKALFPTRHALKRLDQQLLEIHKTTRQVLALQQKASIESSARFRQQVAFLAGEGSDAEISPSLQFISDDIRPVVTRTGSAKTVICTVALGDAYRAATGACLESQRTYAQRWGFDYADLQLPPSRLLRHPSWYKIPLAHHLLARGYEQIAYLDADVLVTRPECPSDSFFGRLSDGNRDLLVSNDESGLNMGVFFARANPTLPILLDLMWSYYFDPHHETWEQIAVRTLVDEFPAVARRILITDQPREFNSFPEERAQIHKLHHQANTWQRGDFLCHFSGMGAPRLQELIARYQDLAGVK